ncbi:MAG TPA: hypothetical protein PLR02_04665, partial [Rhodocyclaceae bacterium]|nr:hypothetical protein [Rhodocyclaceae bacterium]
MSTKENRKRDWHAEAAGLKVDGRAFIDGQRVDALAGATFEIQSPIDGRILGSAARGMGEDIDKAVSVARAAFDDGRWARQAP